MERTKRRQVPSFGAWNYYPEVPVKQSCLVQDPNYDLYYVSSPIKINYHLKQCKGNTGSLGRHYTENKVKQRKEMRNRDVAVKPLDKDLYKIPPELLCEKPRKRSYVRSLLTGCIGLS